MEIAERAAELVEPDFVVGLGTGRAASAFVHALAKRVAEGLRCQGVATSDATARLAQKLFIPVVDFDDVEAIDLTVDGADEVDPELNLIKGYGGALVREKIIASASRHLAILVGPEKMVPVLGSRGTLPIEVLPFAMNFCRRKLAELSLRVRVRTEADHYFLTDNGNLVFDCQVSDIDHPERFDAAIRSIPGVIDTGLFLGLAHTVFVQSGDEVIVHQRTT